MNSPKKMSPEVPGEQITVLNCMLDNRFGGPHRRNGSIAGKLRDFSIETVFLLGEKSKGEVPIEDFECFLVRHIQLIRRKGAVVNFLLFFLFFPANLLKMRRLIKSRNIKIVHVNGLLNIVPVLAGVSKGLPVLWHFNDVHMSNLLRWLSAPFIRCLADRIVVQGKGPGEQCLGNNEKLWNKTSIVYPGVDTRRFGSEMIAPEIRNQVRSEFGVGADEFLVGAVGTMNSHKGYTYFVEAARLIKDRIGTVKFLIVGKKLETYQAYQETVDRLISESGLEDDFIFAGFRTDVEKVLSGMDVFVLSSTGESCPNAVLEAMAMEVPVVATDVGSVSELVVHDSTGLVVEPRNSTAIAGAVVSILQSSEEQRDRMGRKARERIEEVFGLDTISEQQRQIYLDLLRSTRYRRNLHE